MVLGLGVMGAATLRELALRGRRVLGIDRHGIAHDRGSSHGEQRLIRTAYFEHPAYVPLARRAFELWEQIERDAREPLLRRCGLVMIGEPHGPVLTGVRRAAAEHALAVAQLSPEALQTRWPCFRVADGLEVLHEADAGVLFAEACVRAIVSQAVERGAEVRLGVTARNWSVERDAGGCAVRVRTDDGDFLAERLVLCGGPWTTSVAQEWSLPLEVRRKVMLWVAPAPEGLWLERGGPVFAYDVSGTFFYGFPSLDQQTVKAGIHTEGSAVIDPDRLDRSLSDADVAPVRNFVRTCLQGVGHDVQRHSVCMYTMAPDEHFILDRLPDAPEVVIGCGFSGHGFKFAPVVGSILADLVLLSHSSLRPPGLFDLDRFHRS